MEMLKFYKPINLQDHDQMGASSGTGRQVSFRETVEHAMAACSVHHTRDQETRTSDNVNDHTPVTTGPAPAPVLTLVTASGDRALPKYSAASPTSRDRRVSLCTAPTSLPRDAGIKHGTSLTNLKVSGHKIIIG